jgi:hypothetical protein
VIQGFTASAYLLHTLCFRIFKEEEKSFVSLLYLDGTFWRERLLGVTDPLFKQQVLEEGGVDLCKKVFFPTKPTLVRKQIII